MKILHGCAKSSTGTGKWMRGFGLRRIRPTDHETKRALEAGGYVIKLSGWCRRDDGEHRRAKTDFRLFARRTFAAFGLYKKQVCSTIPR